MELVKTVELRSHTENPDLEQACCSKCSDLGFVQMKVEKSVVKTFIKAVKGVPFVSAA